VWNTSRPFSVRNTPDPPVDFPGEFRHLTLRSGGLWRRGPWGVGVRLVDAGDVPGAGLDPKAVAQSARGLRADAGAVRDGCNDVAGAWAGLGASYEAPEAGQLLRAMDPVRADTDRLADELERVASVLATFAGELREIVTKCDRLRVDVVEFRARVAAAPLGGESSSGLGSAPGFNIGSGLGLAPALATQNAVLASQIASVAEELVEAERACAAAIRAIDGPPSPGGFGGFLAGAVDAVSDAAEKAANPWGESAQPELCAGAAVEQVMFGMWNAVSWPTFALAHLTFAKVGGFGVSPIDQEAAWAEAGRSLIGAGVSVAEGFVFGLGDRIDDVTGFAHSSPLTKVDGADSDGREGQRQDSTSDAYGRGPEEQDGAAGPDGNHAIAGPQPYPDVGLGPGVPGTDAPYAEPPGWVPPDMGSDADGDTHGSEDVGLPERANELAIHHAAHGMGVAWPNASRNLLHYLGDSGADLEQPVDDMLNDLPDFRSNVEDREKELGLLAIEQARTSGATGPVSFPVNSKWYEHGYMNADIVADHNWYYGTGAFQYNLSGRVVVHPPETPDGAWRYETDTVVNYRDRYNWDGGKSVVLPEYVPGMGGERVTDERLQDLHKQGLAREFNMLGQSSRRTSEGTE
jgi:hypothetical protein